MKMNQNKYYCSNCHKVISKSNKRRHNKSRCWERVSGAFIK